MVCPKCNSDALTVVDKRNKIGVIRRRRKCMWCDHRFTTIEMPYEAYKTEKQKMLNRLSELVKELNDRKTEEEI